MTTTEQQSTAFNTWYAAYIANGIDNNDGIFDPDPGEQAYAAFQAATAQAHDDHEALMQERDAEIAALERTVVDQTVVITELRVAIAQDRQIRREPVAWQDIGDHAPPRDCLYLEEDRTVGRRVLVTNNIYSETSTGQMSHVWLATPIWDKSKKWWVAFDSNDNKIEGITHWFDPLNLMPQPAEPVKEPSDDELAALWDKIHALFGREPFRIGHVDFARALIARYGRKS